MKYAQYIFGLVILGIILLRLDLNYVLQIMSHVNFALLFAISLITIPQLFLKSLRWHYILNMQGIKYSIWKSFVIYAKGVYFGVITPGRLGELIKVVYLKNEKGVEIGEGFSSVLLDRFFDIYALICISIFSCLAFSVKQPIVWVFIIGILIFIPFLIVVVKVERIRKFFKGILDVFLPKERNNFLRGHVESFYFGFKKISLIGIMALFMLTLCIYVIFFMQCYLLSRLVDQNISFINVLFISSIASLVAIIPVSALGIGTRDAAVVYFFNKLGLAAAKGIVYSFLMFFSFYMMGILVGFLAWNSHFKKNEPGSL